MKKLIYILIILLSFTACNKPSRAVRKMTKELNDTQWEFYYAEDIYGNDITDIVLADSAICQCFEFNKDDDNPSSKNGLASKCTNTYYASYIGNWGVFDWKKRKKEYGDLSSFTNAWAEFGFTSGARINENLATQLYLHAFDFDYEQEDIIIHRIPFRGSNHAPTFEFVEYRYYRKV
jgi:hypothetical protein